MIEANLESVIPFQEPLPKPSLRAEPSSLVPLGQPVTLKCQGPRNVDLYRLEKLQPEKYENQNFLVIPTMERRNAGRYRCSYQNGSQWSLPSDQLELIATGNETGEGEREEGEREEGERSEHCWFCSFSSEPQFWTWGA